VNQKGVDYWRVLWVIRVLFAPNSRTLQGEWSSEARLEKPTDILERYFKAAVDIVSNETETRIEHRHVFEKFAVFAHRQYLAISSSPELSRLNLYMERKRSEINILEESIRSVKSSGSLPGTSNSVSESELERHMTRAKKLLVDDESQAEGHNAAKDMFLRQAIEMYSRSLCSSDENDIQLAIRFCSLWYANYLNVSYDVAIAEAVGRIPSFKFVFLAHQLTARLSDSHPQETGSPRTLRNLVQRLCEEHPFHILPQIFSLRHLGTKSEQAHSQSSVSSMDMSQKSRQRAVLDICNRLSKHKRTTRRIRDVETLCNASLHWATYTISKNDRGGNIPSNSPITKIRDLKVPIITVDLPIDLSLRYDNIVYISRYHPRYKTAGGVNIPKINYCIGSDGKEYKQLVSLMVY
jgi:serine-protein kinase ATM